MHYQGENFSLLFNFDHGNFKYKSDGAIEVMGRQEAIAGDLCCWIPWLWPVDALALMINLGFGFHSPDDGSEYLFRCGSLNQKKAMVKAT